MLLLFSESIFRYCDNFFFLPLNGDFITILILLKKAFLGGSLRFLRSLIYFAQISFSSIVHGNSFFLVHLTNVTFFACWCKWTRYTILFLLIWCNLFMFNLFRTVLFHVFCWKKFLDLIPEYSEILCLCFRRSNGH